MERGWVRLWRKTLDSEVFADAGLFRLWAGCLMLANHSDQWVSVDGLAESVRVRRGQFLTGRYALHDAIYPRHRKSNPSPSTLWRWLDRLKRMGNLDIKTNKRFSIVTVCHYETYNPADAANEQPDEQVNEQPVNSRCAAGEQPVRTNKNDKNYKKGQNEEKGESSRVDHLDFSWDELFIETVLECARRKFIANGQGPFAGGQLPDLDRELLLKLAALAERGRIPGHWLDDAIEAIRHHKTPVNNRAAYLLTCVREKAEANHQNLDQMLALVDLPESIRHRKPPPDEGLDALPRRDVEEPNG